MLMMMMMIMMIMMNMLMGNGDIERRCYEVQERAHLPRRPHVLNSLGVAALNSITLSPCPKLYSSPDTRIQSGRCAKSLRRHLSHTHTVASADSLERLRV